MTFAVELSKAPAAGIAPHMLAADRVTGSGYGKDSHPRFRLPLLDNRNTGMRLGVEVFVDSSRCPA
jgi:hypothetical protein